MKAALSDKQWARINNGRSGFFGHADEATLAWSIAINNAALPDGSDYKITRADVNALLALALDCERIEPEGWTADAAWLRAFAAKLSAIVAPDSA